MIGLCQEGNKAIVAYSWELTLAALMLLLPASASAQKLEVKVIDHQEQTTLCMTRGARNGRKRGLTPFVGPSPCRAPTTLQKVGDLAGKTHDIRRQQEILLMAWNFMHLQIAIEDLFPAEILVGI